MNTPATNQNSWPTIDIANDNQPIATPREGPKPLMRELPPARVFPLAATGALSDGITAIVEKVQAPVALVANSVLAAATLSAQSHADVALPYGQRRPISNYFAVIAASGERKSTVDAEALRPVRAYERKLALRHAADYPRARDARDAHEAARKHILSSGGRRDDVAAINEALEALGAPPALPLSPVIVIGDATPEGLLKNWETSRAGLGLFNAEGGIVVGGHGMSAEARIRTTGTLNAIWDGSPVTRVRAGDGPLAVSGKRMTASIMLQPGLASTFFNDAGLIDQGLVARFLTVAPESRQGQRLFRLTSADTEAAIDRYSDRLFALISRDEPLAEGRRNELVPPALLFSADALQAWTLFFDDVERAVAPDEAFADIRGFAAKAGEHAARLAAVLTLVDDPDASAIDGESMDRAIALVWHYLSEAKRIALSAKIDTRVLGAQRLLTWLNQWPEPFICLPAIYQLGPPEFRTAAQARATVAVLEEHGWLERSSEPQIVRGRVRKEAWRIIRS